MCGTNTQLFLRSRAHSAQKADDEAKFCIIREKELTCILFTGVGIPKKGRITKKKMRETPESAVIIIEDSAAGAI